LRPGKAQGSFTKSSCSPRKRLKNRDFVVRAKAGIQFDQPVLDARFRGHVGNSDVL
jgi:hypothetical protein